jgi:hypothetical protein
MQAFTNDKNEGTTIETRSGPERPECFNYSFRALSFLRRRAMRRSRVGAVERQAGAGRLPRFRPLREAEQLPGELPLFNGLDRDKFPRQVSLRARAARMQHTTLSGRHATRRTGNRCLLFGREFFLFHSDRLQRHQPKSCSVLNIL